MASHGSNYMKKTSMFKDLAPLFVRPPPWGKGTTRGNKMSKQLTMQFPHHFDEDSTRDFFVKTCLKEQSGSSQYPTFANTGQISASQRTFTCRKGQSSPLEHIPFLWKKNANRT
mmetsp:Transcript_25661/g.48898  ORF Transcript_25661/g.48898 Transcript_25661/m.48898 type:complete len:114 (+) Transcript_25661:1250-1591(+)